jgi:hypothetical protein
VLILKVLQAACFDTLSQVLILKGVALHQNGAKMRGKMATHQLKGQLQIKKAAEKPPHRRSPALLPGKDSSKRSMGSQEDFAPAEL